MNRNGFEKTIAVLKPSVGIIDPMGLLTIDKNRATYWHLKAGFELADRPGFCVSIASARRRNGFKTPYSNRLNISVPLVPPKPNELDIAISIFISRAAFGT